MLSTDIRPANIDYTDHRAIKPDKRGPGYWKFNNMYLKGSTYIKYITDIHTGNE